MTFCVKGPVRSMKNYHLVSDLHHLHPDPIIQAGGPVSAPGIWSREGLWSAFQSSDLCSQLEGWGDEVFVCVHMSGVQRRESCVGSGTIPSSFLGLAGERGKQTFLFTHSPTV